MNWMSKVSDTSGKIPTDKVVLGWNKHNGFFFTSIGFMAEGEDESEWGYCWNMHSSSYGFDKEPEEWMMEDDWPTHWCELVEPE